MGFSVKKLREIIIAKYAQEISEQKYDSVRHKLNGCFDFVTFEYYKEHPDRVMSLVETLRSSANDK